MTLEENIKAILECNFSIAREEVIESAKTRIMEQISRQNPLEEELEKIKEEILDKVSMYENDFLIEPHFVKEVINKRISKLKGDNNTSEQVEKKCENCKYWNGGYVTFVCCECKDKSEWKQN